MSEPDNFLSRWSRRKQTAAEAEAKAAPEATEPADEPRPAGANREPTAEAAKPRADTAEPLFDPRSLPAIESITAETDIRAFLAPGVPAELARAALRRAWAADPKIRDFVGPADYAWDYHAPGSMLGFGPLEMTDELRQAVDRIVGGARTDEPGAAHAPPYENTNDSNVPAAPTDRPETPATGGAQESAGNVISEANERDELTPDEKEYVAAQHEPKQSVIFDSTPRRGHGGALPK